MPHLSPSQYLHLPLPFEDPAASTMDSTVSLFKSFAHRKSLLLSIPTSSSNKFQSDDSCQSSLVDPFLDLPSRLRDSKLGADEGRDIVSDSKMEETSSLSSNSTISKDKDSDEGTVNAVKKLQSNIEDSTIMSFSSSSKEAAEEKGNCEEIQPDIEIKKENIEEDLCEANDLLHKNDSNKCHKATESIDNNEFDIKSSSKTHSLQSCCVSSGKLSQQSEQLQPLMTQSYEKSEELLLSQSTFSEGKQDSYSEASFNERRAVQEAFMSQYSFIPTDEEKNEVRFEYCCIMLLI